MVITRFAAGVTRDIATRLRARLVERIDRVIEQSVTRFGARYRRQVMDGIRSIDQKALVTVGPFAPPLDKVFVDVSLDFQAPHKVSAGLLSDQPSGTEERHALGEFLDRRKPEVLAILGAPGSGKTTLLRNTARLACAKRRRRATPILLYLRNHVTDIVSSPPAGLADLVRASFGQQTGEEPVGWFEKRLKAGDCLILLDGLDEIPDHNELRKVSAWLEEQIGLYPRNDYVITARPLGYRSAPIDGATILQVRGFTTDQVEQFVRAWYLTIEKRRANKNSRDIRRRANAGASELLDQLERTPALYDLTVNPLLLTIIANIHQYKKALPDSLPELYDEICQVMLWRREEAKGLPTSSGRMREAVLRAIAYEMTRQKVYDLSQSQILKDLKVALRRAPLQVTAEEFLTDVRSSGFLVERDPGIYCFAHSTLQEYLATAHARSKGLAPILAGAANDSWWGKVEAEETAPYFFLSYARTPKRHPEDPGDPDRWVVKLYRDLCEAIYQMTDVRQGDAGFMDTAVYPDNRRPREFATALATCRVFVPLYSQRYFASENCGREWQAFAQRKSSGTAQTGTRPQAIVPALWAPLHETELPEVAKVIQFVHHDFGPRYDAQGFYGFIKLSRFRADYQLAVHRLANRIIDVADTTPLRPGKPADYLPLESAFGVRNSKNPPEGPRLRL